MAEEKQKKITPKQVYDDYEAAKAYKSSLGDGRGLYEQCKLNERFMLGDQWHGSDTGDLPKPVINIIKQIGDFKVANIVSNPTTAVYEFDGVPTWLEAQRNPDVGSLMNTMSTVNGVRLPTDKEAEEVTFEDEMNAVATALTSHFRSVWERCKLDKLNQTGVRKAYIHGLYVLYLYFNPELKTGLYADEGRKTPVKGDIEAEILDVTNVYFGDPAETDVQKQPYVIISQRKTLDAVKSVMRLNKRSQADIDELKADDETDEAGNYSDDNANKKKVTLLTLFKRDLESGKIMAMQCTKTVTVREEWDTELEMYPFAVMPWDETDRCIYGHSEITEIIPNQISINRMIAFEILSEWMMGMPKIIYDSTVITQEITNDPGQIIAVEGGGDVQNSFRYVNPAQISPNWNRVQQALIDNTKTVSGATAVALGDVRPDNTSAIIALREAANMPLQPILNRFYAFDEDIARICGEIILKKYGKRSLKVTHNGQTSYVPFDADKYKDMVLNARIEVGPSTLWATSTVISTLGNLLQAGVIDVAQYLERMPEGYIPKKQELISEIRAKQQQEQQMQEALAQQQAAPQPQPEQAQGVRPEAIMSQLDDEQLAVVQEHPEMMQSVL